MDELLDLYETWVKSLDISPLDRWINIYGSGSGYIAGPGRTILNFHTLEQAAGWLRGELEKAASDRYEQQRQTDEEAMRLEEIENCQHDNVDHGVCTNCGQSV